MARLDTSLLPLTGYRLRRTTSALLSMMAPVFSKFGLRRTTYSTLALALDHPGLRQSQMAEALGIDRPNFVQIVDELESAGLVRREKATDDRRANAVYATDAGAALFRQAAKAVFAYERETTTGLSAAQVAALHAALETIDRNVARLEARDGT